MWACLVQSTLDNVIAEAQLVPYPEREEEGGGLGDDMSAGRARGGPPPLSMAITEFHFLLLFTGRLQVVSRLNGAVVQVMRLHGYVWYGIFALGILGYSRFTKFGWAGKHTHVIVNPTNSPTPKGQPNPKKK